MTETHYDGIRRVTKDTDISNKTERITISKSYLELYKEKRQNSQQYCTSQELLHQIDKLKP